MAERLASFMMTGLRHSRRFRLSLSVGWCPRLSKSAEPRTGPGALRSARSSRCCRTSRVGFLG